MIALRGSRFQYDAVINGSRVRVSLGTPHEKVAVRLENRISFALAEGPKSPVWNELRHALPASSFKILTKGYGLTAQPKLAEFRKQFEDRLDRRVKLGELAEGSRNLYLWAAGVFFNRMTELGIGSLEEITPTIAETYLIWRKEAILTRGGSARGMVTEHTVLSAIFNYAREEGVIQISPLKGKAYKVDADTKIPKPFSEKELDKLYAALDNATRLPFLLLRWTGLRASDAVAVTEDSINWTDKSLRWKTKKRGVIVNIPLHPELFEALEPNFPPETRLLHGMTQENLYRMIRGLGERAGVSDCHPHRFRNSIACGLLGEGASLFDVAKFLGDSHAVVEKHYAAITDKQQDRIRGIMTGKEKS